MSGVRLQQDLAEIDDLGLNPETSKSGGGKRLT